MKRTLYFDIFIAGGTTIAVEFAASRSLQNVYGASNFVWATIIGSIMIYFALGYYFGGKVAERNQNPANLFKLQAFASGFLFVIPYFSNMVLLQGANAFDQLDLPIMAGAFLSVIVIYSIPIILLAMTTPIAIKLLFSSDGDAGKVAGMVSAVSTIGSVFGAFIPTLYLFGAIGTSRSIQAIAILMFTTAMIGIIVVQNKKILPSLMLILFLAISFPVLKDGTRIKNTPNQVFETESAYNYIEVIQQGDNTYLRLNEGQGYHSQYNPNSMFYQGPWETFLLGPLFEPRGAFFSVDRVTVVGSAAGTTLRQASIVYPEAFLTGIEIDAKIVDAGYRYFGLEPDAAKIIIGDGRYELTQIEDLQDLIIVDAYVPPYIPGHLVTAEFFALCAAKLTDDGVVAINVGRTETDRSLIDDLATTISTSFEHILIVDLPNTFNTIIFASRQPLTVSNFIQNYTQFDQTTPGKELLTTIGAWVFNSIKAGYSKGTVYTDDRNQIDLVTNRLILNFLVSD